MMPVLEAIPIMPIKIKIALLPPMLEIIKAGKISKSG
jgi:hypothetical protein